jgi:MinD-like ATPase involved in chromosome partitioning or flagellar assembly
VTIQPGPPADQQIRTTVALALPGAERAGLPELFAEVGFGTIVGNGAADLAAILSIGAHVSLAIVDSGETPAETIELVREARAGLGRKLPVLYVTDDGELDALTEGLEDSDEILLRPVNAEALRWRLEAMTIRAQVGDGAAGETVFASGTVHADWLTSSPIVSVFNPKGGVGKTTIATNLAAVLQLRREREVLLVDGDTVTGHIALSLGLQPGTSLADQFADEDGGEPHRTVMELATKHSSGIRVVALTNSPLSLSHLAPERVSDAIMEARHGVGTIIVDLHPSYSEVNLAIFAISDRIIVPVTPDLPAIRAAVQLKEVATELGMGERLALVVNRANSGVSVSDIEVTTGMKAVGEIRSAGMNFVWSANVGRTVIEKFPKHKVVEDFERLADRLLAAPGQAKAAVPERDVRSMLRSLLGRSLPAQA